ncbi:hypothetical protein NHX12_010022 [Muraenolepis orangiensis]|uniref:Thrombospondin type-1 domain-containing protein 1 n=1 Tax=Muraenolepis orangiensis TaxID=630683 RepID=A0A9Q0DHG0_9TELE|nr:hypothetical protein NHX12_010022 [Muraenolepis orangiensis]
MAQCCAPLLPCLLALMGYAAAALSIWPSLHIALSNASVFVDFSTACNRSSVCNATLSLVHMESNSTLLTRNLPENQSEGRVEFNCSCFLYAGIFRFHLKQTAIGRPSHGSESTLGTTRWWSSELHVQWPTFHIGIERLANNSGSFQVGISTNEHFQGCSGDHSSALSLEVSYVEYNQIGQNSIDKVRVRTHQPIRALRSQSVELPCAFPFTEKDFVRVALRSPHTNQEVKSSGPLYLSRIFSYKLQVDDASLYRTGCDGTMTVRLLAPPCAAVNGKDEPSGATALLAFHWLTHGENQTEFNCSVFHPGKNRYCLRFVFNYSRLPSPAQTCLVVHRSVESWGPWDPWSPCSVSCGEGLRERVRQCLSRPGVPGRQCPGLGMEQSPCSLEDCMATAGPSPSPPTTPTGATALGGNLMVVAGISLCLAIILATLLFTAWRKLCRAPPCSSVRQGSMHSTGGRKLSDEASIFGNSLQRPSLMEAQGLQGMGSASQRQMPLLGSQSLSQPLVFPVSPDPDRLSPSGQKLLPPMFGYRLAQQQLKEMKKQGLTEATQVYHVSSSPEHPQAAERSPIGTPMKTIASDRLSPRAEFQPGLPLPGYGGGGAAGGSSRRHERTADWVEMVERNRMSRSGGVGAGNSSYPMNPNFRRTCSFTDAKSQPPALAGSRAFRERSMTQVASRTLPEGSCRARGIREGHPYPAFPSYPIPELGLSEWGASTLKRTWLETAAPSLSSQHTGTRTSERHDETLERVERDRLKSAGSGSGRGVGGGGLQPYGGPRNGPLCSPQSTNQLALERAERAEQCWSRRGPSPIQRNILARKLKEAQACSAAPGGPGGRQRSATFSASTAEQRKSHCHSLPMAGSPYRLSDAEQRMMDLDLPSS